MWALFGGFRCSKCGRLLGIWQRARRSPLSPRLAVCRDCLSLWERTGRRCGRCWHPIQHWWDLGLLLDRGVFAHVDCGGASILPAGWSGRLALPPADLMGGVVNSEALNERGEATAGKPLVPTISAAE